MHHYYTPKLMKIQAFLAKTAFFVNYDKIYVYIFMLTNVNGFSKAFIIFNYLTISWVFF